MARLNKHQIYASVDLKTEIIELPEWGGDIEIKVMSMAQKLAYDKYVQDKEFDDICFYLIRVSCINEDGSYVFNDNDEDKQNLMSKDLKSIMRLFDACVKINKAKQGDVEEAEKN